MSSARCWRTAGRGLIAAAPLLLLVAPLRQGLESRMLLHMLVEFPLLFAAGWALCARVPPLTDAIDRHGLLGATMSSCVAAFWMIPAALDAALLWTPVQCAKLASWLLAGLLLGRSWPRLHDEARMFFLGNLGWMMATVGILFQSVERRLCANYLLADQQLTGVALVGLGLVLGLLATAIMFDVRFIPRGHRSFAAERGEGAAQDSGSAAESTNSRRLHVP